MGITQIALVEHGAIANTGLRRMTMTDSIFERNLTTQDFQIIAPVEESSGLEFLSIPKARIPEMAEKYIQLMEVEQSNKWCKCEWQIHPDDVKVKDGHCRKCENLKDHPIHIDELGNPECKFTGKRKRRSDENPQCPVHTRAGLILGFFEWLFSDEMAEMRD